MRHLIGAPRCMLIMLSLRLHVNRIYLVYVDISLSGPIPLETLELEAPNNGPSVPGTLRTRIVP